ncbi:hypothetical protein V493_03476, partial [Pseudogymnoascus sp. VKM F-4281 (FW-2241)]
TKANGVTGLLTEKGIKRTGADEKKVTDQMDQHAPDSNGSGRGGKEHEKMDKLKDKLKNAVHKA